MTWFSLPFLVFNLCFDTFYCIMNKKICLCFPLRTDWHRHVTPVERWFYKAPQNTNCDGIRMQCGKSRETSSMFYWLHQTCEGSSVSAAYGAGAGAAADAQVAARSRPRGPSGQSSPTSHLLHRGGEGEPAKTGRAEQDLRVAHTHGPLSSLFHHIHLVPSYWSQSGLFSSLFWCFPPRLRPLSETCPLRSGSTVTFL